MSPSPNWRHQQISNNIELQIQLYLKRNDVGRVFHAPLDVVLNETNVYQPDVLFFRKGREELLGDRCIEGAPDFVVEILSESTERLDRELKRKIYARSGVKELWFVDPIKREVSIFEFAKSVGSPARIHRDKDEFTSGIFPGLTFSCSDIFGKI
jgi:Uma2 family endonuclease